MIVQSLPHLEKKIINCLYDDENIAPINVYDNKGRNKKLYATLLSLRYGITKIKGSYIENYLSANAIEVKDDSYFVVNLKDDHRFIENIIELGKLFCQDSIVIIGKGGQNNYLYGTNHHEYPGLDTKVNLGFFKGGIEGEFMSKIKNRPFVLESFKDLQNNTKYLVERDAKEIIKFLKKI